jgi:hypothetical protein
MNKESSLAVYSRLVPTMTVITPEFQDRLNRRAGEAMESIDETLQGVVQRWNSYKSYLTTRPTSNLSIAITSDLEIFARDLRRVLEHVYVR